MSTPAFISLGFKNATWRAEGACAGWVQQPGQEGGQEDDPFFAPSAKVQRKAAEFCKECCPMLERCGTFALENDERYGVWGGMTERDREKLQRQQGLIRPRGWQLFQMTNQPRPSLV